MSRQRQVLQKKIENVLLQELALGGMFGMQMCILPLAKLATTIHQIETL